MQPRERDAAYLWDMLDAAQAVRQFTANMDADQYMSNRQVQMAVERAVRR